MMLPVEQAQNKIPKNKNNTPAVRFPAENTPTQNLIRWHKKPQIFHIDTHAKL